MNSGVFKYFILPFILFFASLAIIFLVLLPIYNDIKSNIDLREQNKSNLSDRIKLTSSLESLVKQYNQRLNDVNSFSRVIPENQNIPEILVNLEALASENGLVFSSVDFTPKDLKVAGVKTLIMAVRVKGSYPAFKNYLGAIEKSLRIFDVMSLSFSGVSRGASNTNANDLEFNLIINTYYQ